jgi:hypothetical protein
MYKTNAVRTAIAKKRIACATTGYRYAEHTHVAFSHTCVAGGQALQGQDSNIQGCSLYQFAKSLTWGVDVVSHRQT